MHILHCFSLVSGLKINLQKSHLLGVGISTQIVNAAAMSLDCSVMRAPFKYLGVMVGGNMSLVKSWDEIIGKLNSRLSKWKSSTLSIGGRLTLLKLVLGSSLIYTMSLHKVPKSVLNEMESIRRRFFYGSHGAVNKIMWVKWSKVLAAKKYGGLGVSSYFTLNRALLFRWVWRFTVRDNTLWYRVISSIHGDRSSHCSYRFPSVWGKIIREVHVLKNQGIDLLSYCRIRVGNGSQTRFWKDPWIDDNLLCHLFPRVYALESNCDISVADKMIDPVNGSLRRPARGGIEAHQLSQLQLLVGPVILSNANDRWVWSLSGDGVFQVKDIRRLLDESFLPKDNTATRWVKFIPIKINVFAWKVSIDRLPTRMNLLRRDIHVPDLFCPICKDSTEDSSHLFFSCDLAVDISRLVCRWWNLTWSPLASYDEWLTWFKGIRLGSKLKNMLEGVFYIVWWSIWNFRNCLLFAAQNPRKDIIFDNIVMRAYTWCHARCNSSFSWDSWLQHLYLISL
ncbi:RNA-directed DNA polymerase, eukaryota [Tanacetum coccineum]